MKTFVIAGTYAQGMAWVRQNISDYVTTHGGWRSLSDYVIVKDAISLKGYSNPHGVFVGTWRDRKDIKDIVVGIHLQSAGTNVAIKNIMTELGII